MACTATGDMQTTNSGNTFSVFPEEFENPTRVHSFASLNPFAQAKYISSLSGMINDMISSSQAKASSNRASVFRRTLMLLVVPVVGASRGIGFKWAQATSDHGIPAGLASLVGSLVLLPALLVTLARSHGHAAVKECASRKYLGMCLGGTFNGLAKCLALASIKLISPTIQDVLMQSGMVFLLVINTAVLRRPPPSTTCVSVVLVCVQGASFTMSYHADGEQEQFNWIGVVFGLAAAFCEVSGDALIEYMTTDESSDESSADILRVLVMNEAWKLPVTVVFCFIFDSEYLSGMYGTGWIPYLVVGGALPLCLHVGFGNFCISLYGSIPVNLAASLRVLLIYASEVLILQLAALDAQHVFMLVGLVSAVMLNTIIEKRAMDEQVLGELKALENIKSQMQLDPPNRSIGRSMGRDPQPPPFILTI